MDVACKRCPYFDNVRQVTPGAVCPDCGAFLCKRVKPAPTPGSHGKDVVAAVLSVPGILMLVLVGFMRGQTYIGRVQLLGAIILFLTSVRMAWGSVNFKDKIGFPSISVTSESLWPVAVYSLVFTIIPSLLLPFALFSPPKEEYPGGYEGSGYARGYGGEDGYAEQGGGYRGDEEGEDIEASPAERAAMARLAGSTAPAGKSAQQERWEQQEREARAAWDAAQKAERKKMIAWRLAAGILGLLLLLYAAMALAMFIVTNNIWGMFHASAGLKLIRADVGGYFGLSLVVAAVNVAGLVSRMGFVRNSLVTSIGLATVNAFCTLVVYGLCGLYVRKHARLLGIPVDEDEWEPIPVPPVGAVPSGAPVRGRTGIPAGSPTTGPVAAQQPPAPRVVQPIELDDVPAVQGSLWTGPQGVSGPPPGVPWQPPAPAPVAPAPASLPAAPGANPLWGGPPSFPTSSAGPAGAPGWATPAGTPTPSWAAPTGAPAASPLWPGPSATPGPVAPPGWGAAATPSPAPVAGAPSWATAPNAPAPSAVAPPAWGAPAGPAAPAWGPAPAPQAPAAPTWAAQAPAATPAPSWATSASASTAAPTWGEQASAPGSLPAGAPGAGVVPPKPSTGGTGNA